MKSYDETVNDVFERISEYKTAQKRKRRIITSTAACLCCACLIALIGIGSHNINSELPLGMEQTGGSTDSPSTADQNQSVNNAANLPNNAEPSVPSKQVIRSYEGSETERYVLPKNGEILTTLPLCMAMEEYGDSVRYQIEVLLLRNDGEAYVSDKAQWLQEFERLSKITGDEQLGLSTYRDGEQQEHYMLTGIVSKQLIDHFPASDQYGYLISLPGVSEDCTYNGTFSINHGKASQQ